MPGPPMLQGPFRVPSFNGYIPRRMPLLPVLVQGAPSEIYPTAHDRRGNDGMLSRNDVFPHRHRRAHHLPALGHSAYPQHPEEDASLELCGKKNEEKSCIIQRFMLTLQTKKVSNMTKKGKHTVLFICLGNICRSPAAEGIMKSLVEKADRKSVV